MKSGITLLFPVFFYCFSPSICQTQIGSDIDGEAAGDLSGIFVSISADGSRVAVGASRNDGNGNNSGHVRTYDLMAGNWVQAGSDIDGEAPDDQLGYSVSLSADGNRLAVGGRLNDGSGLDAGYAQVYELIGNTWTQLGGDIDGEAAGDQAGFAVALSAAGDRVAVGAFRNDGNGSGAGHVRVFEFGMGAWNQLGGDLDGEAAGDESGSAIAFSADGNRLAIGALNNDASGTNAGHVRVYQLNAGTWMQMGNDIDGAAVEDGFGRSVSLSADGLRLAVGAPGNDDNGAEAGQVVVYDFSGGAWSQVGAAIDGEASGDESGFSVSLSADGMLLTIGAVNNDGGGQDAGQVRIYEWDGVAWTQAGVDIDGEAAGDVFGQNVAMASEGNYIVVGAPGNDGSGAGAGHARVFRRAGLPVQLSTFRKSVNNGQVWLGWETASERNNRGFQLEHSTDGHRWAELAFVKGSGTTEEISQYSYIHTRPGIGPNYYRLQQIDFDGYKVRSHILSVIIDQPDPKIKLYPIPAADVLTVSGAEGLAEIYDLQGQRRLRQSLVTGNTDLMLAGLPPGAYLLVIKSAGAATPGKLFIKGGQLPR